MNSRKKSGKTAAFLVFIAIILGAALYTYNYLMSFSGPSRAGEGEIKTKVVKKDEPVNLLLMGLDIGDPKAKNADDPKRTDTIMLINYNPKIDEINMVSIPRDTLIKIKGKNYKINAAHAVGGVNYTIEAVSNLLDVDINYYGKVDYKGFREVIDAIGGVDMKIGRRMDYDDPSQHLSIHFNKGEYVHLDGEKAEEFFRWRKNNDGTGLADGDIGRIENQHLLIEKVIDKVKSPACAAKVLPVIPQYIETNMRPEEIIKYGYVMARTDKDKISMTTLKGDTDYIDNLSYFIYDMKQNKELLSKLHVDDNSAEASSINFERSSANIQILNGCGRSGLAAKIGEKAQQKGYINVALGNAQKTQESKIITYGMDKETQNAVRKDFGINNLTNYPQKNQEFDIIVLLGDNFKD